MINNFFLRLMSLLILIPLFLFCLFEGGIVFNFFLFVLFLVSSYEIIKLKINYSKYLLLIILLIFIYSFYNIRNQSDGLRMILLLTFITWCSDIGGYLFGKLIGGKKIKFISPNKTFSGFFGSLLFVQLNLVYIIYFKLNLFSYIGHYVLFLTVCSFIVIFGDLFFSYVKRLNNIKDYSNFIPGHGGVLDRIDGFIFLIIIFNTVYLLI